MYRQDHFLLQVVHFFYLYQEAKVLVLYSAWEKPIILQIHAHQENHCLKSAIGPALNSAYSIHFVKSDRIKHLSLLPIHLELFQFPYQSDLETVSLTYYKLPPLYTVYNAAIKQLLNRCESGLSSHQYNLTSLQVQDTQALANHDVQQSNIEY